MIALLAHLFLAPVVGVSPTAPIVLQAMGDLMLGGNAREVLEERGWDWPYGEVGAVLREGDVNFANLEGPVTDRRRGIPGKEYTFHVPRAAFHAAVTAGVGLFSLANNHMMDQGAEGLDDTLEALREEGVSGAGAGDDLAEARRPAIVVVRGRRIALLAYSLTHPESFYATATGPGTHFARIEDLEEDVPRAATSSELIVVSFHWGEELRPTPKAYQVEMAHRAIDLGARLVLGHHPHCLQGIERYHGGVIFYSLGNFVFGSYSRNVTDGVVARVVLAAGDDRLVPREVTLIPLDISNPEVIFRPRVLVGEEGRKAVEALAELSLPLGTRITWDGKRGRVEGAAPPAGP